MDEKATAATPVKDESGRPGLKTLFLSFLRLGVSAFGGPAMVAHIGELAVKRRNWLDQQAFKSGVALCQSIPGATAMQAAAYVGLRTRGLPGALATYIGFGLPAFLLMVILSSLYAASRNLPWVASLFHGLQVIVVAVVAHATYLFGRGALRRRLDVLVATGAAGAFWAGISPFYVIAGAALAGTAILKSDPGQTAVVGPARPGLLLTTHTHVAGLLLAVLLGLFCLYLTSTKLLTLSLLMLKIDLFAFGGGFASLPLMLQEIVNARGWMDSKTFMDGIALGQITPGPIVITASFVGYLLNGLSGAIVATISVFAPSFILLVVTTPFFDRLKQSALFTKAVKGILASFVGLLLYVTVKFTAEVSWDVVRIALAAGALIALLRKIDNIYIILTGAALSILAFR